MSAPAVEAESTALVLPEVEPLLITNLGTGEKVELSYALTPQEACHRHVNVGALIGALQAYQRGLEVIIADHMAASHATRMFADGVTYKYEAGTETVVDHAQLIAGLRALAAEDVPVLPADVVEAAILGKEPPPPPPLKVHLGKLKGLLKYGDRVTALVAQYKRDFPKAASLVIERQVQP